MIKTDSQTYTVGWPHGLDDPGTPQNSNGGGGVSEKKTPWESLEVEGKMLFWEDYVDLLQIRTSRTAARYGEIWRKEIGVAVA